MRIFFSHRSATIFFRANQEQIFSVLKGPTKATSNGCSLSRIHVLIQRINSIRIPLLLYRFMIGLL